MPNNMKYINAWRWPKQVEDYIKSRAQGFTLHLCNGDSNFGDLRIDLYSQNTDITANMLYLPIKSNSFDTVVCDPPWAMDNRFRIRLATEVRRVLKFGGLFILNAPWCPKIPSLTIQEVLVPSYQLMMSKNLTLLWLLRKIKTSFFADWDHAYLKNTASRLKHGKD